MGGKTGWSELVAIGGGPDNRNFLLGNIAAAACEQYPTLLKPLLWEPGAGTGDSACSRSRALTISFNQQTSGDTPEVKHLYSL
ncbi:hypothetical protein Tco_0796857 [Tanacetum coccineum]